MIESQLKPPIQETVAGREELQAREGLQALLLF